MAILEKDVWVTLSNRMIAFYENKGYTIPRCKNSSGRMGVKTGTKIKVKIEDLSKQSNAMVTKQCDVCGMVNKNQKYNNVINRRTDKDYCTSCSKEMVIMNKLKRSYKEAENILSSEGYSVIKNDKLEISNRDMKMMSFICEKGHENRISCREIVRGRRCKKCSTLNRAKASAHSEIDFIKYIENEGYTFVKWEMEYLNAFSPILIKCDQNHIFKTNRHKFMNRGNRCPYCSGRMATSETCLSVTHPEIATLLLDIKQGYNLSKGSHKKAKFKCPDCSYVSNKMINNVVKQGYSCPKCSDGISYPEKIMLNILEQLSINYEFQVSAKKLFKNQELPKKIYDFYLKDTSTIIEIHGMQHYEECFSRIKNTKHNVRELKEEQENDMVKRMIADDNGIINYIEIDARYSELEYIKNSIVESMFGRLYNCISLDWIKVEEKSRHSYIKIASALWEKDGLSTKEISEKLKCHVGTVCKYLKIGASLGWCTYDSRLSNKKKVVQLSTYSEFIKVWDSILEASEKTNTHSSSICNVCKGRGCSQAGGYKWMYKEDYDKYIEEKNKEYIS